MQIYVHFLEVLIKSRWIPFVIFESGKYANDIKTFREHASGQQDQSTEAMILAEALCADIRYVDPHHGVYYRVHIEKGGPTKMASYTENDRHIKDFAWGKGIPEDWKGELEHVLDI